MYVTLEIYLKIFKSKKTLSSLASSTFFKYAQNEGFAF
jgi:hypothetical protein